MQSHLGILHTKAWTVDGKHLYVGSANFDWRSLTQVSIAKNTFSVNSFNKKKNYIYL